MGTAYGQAVPDSRRVDTNWAAATWTESGTGSGRINVYAEYTPSAGGGQPPRTLYLFNQMR